MDYLARGGAPFSGNLWGQIDEAVNETARKVLIGRRFLSVFGPLGAGAQSIQNDKSTKDEVSENGQVKTVGRSYQEISQLYTDFTLLWRDLENNEKSGWPLELSSALAAAQSLARKEDELIFFGNSFLGVEGLLNAEGAASITRSDWNTGENAFTDIAGGLSQLNRQGMIGRYALCLSPDLYCSLQRIQPGTGMMVIDRISRQLEGRVFNAPVLGENKAVLLCAEPQYMDLVIGQDMAAAYLEQKDLNHSLRILETILPRIKNSSAIVVFE